MAAAAVVSARQVILLPYNVARSALRLPADLFLCSSFASARLSAKLPPPSGRPPIGPLGVTPARCFEGQILIMKPDEARLISASQHDGSPAPKPAGRRVEAVQAIADNNRRVDLKRYEAGNQRWLAWP